MGALTFDALLRSLKQGAPHPVYYLHGEEDVLKDEAVRALLERAVDPAARDFNVDQRSAADLDPEAFNALVNTPPILATTRAVVLRGMEQLRKTAKVRQELLHYLDSPNPTTVLVLVNGTAEPPDGELVRRTTAVEVAALPPERVERLDGTPRQAAGIHPRARGRGAVAGERRKRPQQPRPRARETGAALPGAAGQPGRSGRARGRAPRRNTPGFHRSGPRAARSGRRPPGRAGARAGRHERRPHAQRARHRARRHGAGPSGTRPRRATTRSPRGCAAVPPPGGATLWPGKLGADRAPLG